MTTPSPGWYPDPADAGQHRWWDGAAWTDATSSGSPGHAARAGRRGQQVAVALALTLLSAGTVAGALHLLPSAAAVDAVADLASDPGGPPPAPSPAPEATAPHATGSADAADSEAGDGAAAAAARPGSDEREAESGPIRILVAGQERQLELRDGRATLADGRAVELVEQLRATGDLTGDGRDEEVLVFDIAGNGLSRPAIGVVGWSADGGRVVLDPPALVAHRPYSETFEVDVGAIDRLSVRDGALEVGVTIPPSVAGAPEQRPEIRLTWTGSGWNVSADGPVTRAARAHAESFYGLRFAELVCDGRAELRGQHPWCAGQPDGEAHDRLFVTLLLTDDEGGFRSSMGRDGPISRAEEVRASLGTGDLFCRDIAREATQGLGVDWELPMAAIAYWFDEGMPARMDASGNGMPCQTVFEGVEEFLDGSDGRIEEGYAHRRER